MDNLNYSQRLKLRLLLPFLKKTDKIIDLGCGNMWLTKHLRNKGYNCIGFAMEAPADIIGNIKTYTFKKHQFDIVIALEMFEHVDCFEEVDYMLKPDGFLILSTPVPHFDPFCRILEKIKILQDRITPHSNLFYLDDVPFIPVYKKVLMGINQFGVFQKDLSQKKKLK